MRTLPLPPASPPAWLSCQEGQQQLLQEPAAAAAWPGWQGSGQQLWWGGQGGGVQQSDVNKNEMQVITITGKIRILVVWNEKNWIKWIRFLFKYSEIGMNKCFRVKVGCFI